LTQATNLIAATLSGAVAQQLIGGPWWEAAFAALMTGFVVMTFLIRINPP
jgi:hypothetical protein